MTVAPKLPKHFYFGREQILVLGDSHAAVFKHWRFRLKMPRVSTDCCIVGGATISGLKNPNSKTQSLAKFRAAIMNSAPTLIVTLLGEVDAGFVIWHRAERYAQETNEMLRQAVKNYELLISDAARKAPVIAVSAPLPTIRDGQDWGKVADLRKGVTASQRERTELTLKLNSCVQSSARRLGQASVNLDKKCLGKDGLVADWLLNRNPTDHHYDRGRYASFLASELAMAIRQLRHQRATSNEHALLNSVSKTD